VGKKVWNYEKRCLPWYPGGSLPASQRKHFWQTRQSGCQNSITGAPGTMVNINMQNYRAIAIRLISMSCFKTIHQLMHRPKYLSSPMGERLSKEIYDENDAWVETTYYIRDALVRNFKDFAPAKL